MTERDQRFGGGSVHAGPPVVEEVEARAARLGITLERVLEEYARIAYTSLHDIVEWDDKGMKLKDGADTAAIIEIVAAAGSGRPYRIKLHDKRPFLEAIECHLDKLSQNEDEQTDDNGEDPREVLARKIARIAAAGGMDKGSLVE